MTTFDPQAQAKRIRCNLRSAMINCLAGARYDDDQAAEDLLREFEARLPEFEDLQSPEEMIALLGDLHEYADLLASELQTRTTKDLARAVERHTTSVRSWLPPVEDAHERRPSLCYGTAATEWYDKL